MLLYGVVNLIDSSILNFSQDPTKVITSFNEVPEAIRDESIKMVELLRSMPYQITSSQEQLKWDLVMLKCQVTSFTYGIPGESQCFQCFQHFNSITDRFQHEFNHHGEYLF